MALAGAGKLGLPKLHGAMAKALFGKKNVHGATRQGGGGRRLSLANAPSQRDARPLLKHKQTVQNAALLTSKIQAFLTLPQKCSMWDSSDTSKMQHFRGCLKNATS